ncbi:MAG TPA: hypothetical protein VKA36_10765 [Solirubrobacterales bacterium]|nr:hypothetical protein [Solirubrobacterales bacterium]
MKRTTFWRLYTLLGVAALIGATVATAASAEPAEAGERVLRVFGIGALLFFVPVFGAGMWQRRPRDRSGLEGVYAELAGSSEAPVDGPRLLAMADRVGFALLGFGALITLIGVVVILDIAGQAGGDDEIRLSPLAWIAAGAVVLAAFTVRPMLRGVNASVDLALAPLGLSRAFGSITGTRHGHKVKVTFTPDLTTTEVSSVVITRPGADSCDWLRDLLEAERRAGSAE